MRTLQTASDSRECSPTEPREAGGRECLDVQTYSQCYVTAVMLSLFLLVIHYIFSLEGRGRMETNNKLLRFSLVLRYHLHKIKFTHLKSMV